MSSFARLPVSLTISLSLFESKVSDCLLLLLENKESCSIGDIGSTISCIGSPRFDHIVATRLYSQPEDNVAHGQSSNAQGCAKTS